MEAQHPSVKIVRNFVHLLDHSDRDYSEDIELQKLRQQVVKEIRSNQQLEHDLDTMDIKIGLLVKNRITLQVSGSTLSVPNFMDLYKLYVSFVSLLAKMAYLCLHTFSCMHFFENIWKNPHLTFR